MQNECITNPYDVWRYCILPKLSPLEVLTMSFVCKTFKEWLKAKINSQLCLTFLVLCQPCGSHNDSHVCKWALDMGINCSDKSKQHMVKQIWKYYYTTETHDINLIDLNIVKGYEDDDLYFWIFQTKNPISLYWSCEKRMVASTWFLIFWDSTYGFYVHENMHHNETHVKGFYVENEDGANRIQNACLHWKNVQYTDTDLLNRLFDNKNPSF